MNLHQRNFEQIRDKYKLMIGKILGTEDFKLRETFSKCSYMEKLSVGKWKLTSGLRHGLKWLCERYLETWKARC